MCYFFPSFLSFYLSVQLMGSFCTRSIFDVPSAQAWRGDILMKVPVTYDYLKFIEIGNMDYNDMDEVLYVLHLLLQSPNLQELHISVSRISCSFVCCFMSIY